MPYKTLLLHCNDKARIRRILAPAVDMAVDFEAHLIGTSVTPPAILIPAGMPGAPDTVRVDDHCKAYREGNPEMKAAFDAMTRGRTITAEWREVEAGMDSVADALVKEARVCDLVIAAQTDVKWPGSAHLDVAERVMTDGGRPVLVIPNAGTQKALGKNILVAWNGRREAARAVFDALPLLRRAAVVTVVWVNPQSEIDPPGDVPAGDICATLARHGVKCEATKAVLPKMSVGRTLLQQAETCGADLLVMGCYGHTRLREFVLGGASGYVLKHMTLPVLMSH